MNHNNNCDGSHCATSQGDVRILSTGGAGNLILCQSCFDHELRWRRERNKRLSVEAQFSLPSWQSLQVYP